MMKKRGPVEGSMWYMTNRTGRFTATHTSTLSSSLGLSTSWWQSPTGSSKQYISLPFITLFYLSVFILFTIASTWPRIVWTRKYQSKMLRGETPSSTWWNERCSVNFMIHSTCILLLHHCMMMYFQPIILKCIVTWTTQKEEWLQVSTFWYACLQWALLILIELWELLYQSSC